MPSNSNNKNFSSYSNSFTGYKWVLLGILVLAFLLRLWGAGNYDLFGDEAVDAFRGVGYIDFLGTSFQTQPIDWYKDTVLPWWTHLSFHDFPPMAMIIQHIFFSLFGDSILTARLPAIFLGTFSVYLIFLIVRRLFMRADLAVWVAFLFAIIIPGGYVLWLIEKRDIHDIHLSIHDQRKIPFLLAGISATLGAIALFLVGAAKPVIVMGVVYAVNAVAVGLLTLVWKISIHTAFYSAIITVIVILFGIPYGWLYLILIPLCWSRIYRHRHSLNQVLGGAMIAFILTSIVFWLFGYISDQK